MSRIVEVHEFYAVCDKIDCPWTGRAYSSSDRRVAELIAEAHDIENHSTPEQELARKQHEGWTHDT